MENDLLKKWLKGELSAEETALFQKDKSFEFHQRINEQAKFFKAPDIKDQYPVEDVFNKAQSVSNTFHFKPLLKVAASVTILAMLSLFYFLNSDTTVKTLVGEKKTYSLPDQSEFILNAGSQLTYNAKNWENNRKLYLHGESFFKVSKGETFKVITDKGSVQVVGTQFNVHARERFFEVICFEGVVQVLLQNQKKTLKRGDRLTLIDNQLSLHTVSIEQPDWTNNKTTFNSQSLNMVLEEFERQYNFKINADLINTKRLFTGGFIHNHMEEAIKSITLPLDISYTIDSSKKIIQLQENSKNTIR